MESNSTENTTYILKQNIRDLELSILKNRERIKKTTVREIDHDVQQEFENIFSRLNEVSTDNPESLLKMAFDSLNALERKQFILNNLLESLKRGEQYNILIERYNELGLTNVTVPKTTPNEKKSQKGKGTGLLNSMQSVKNFARALYRIVLNSIKSIPRFIALKPRVGLSGMFPTISFEIEGSGLVIQEFYELLSESA